MELYWTASILLLLDKFGQSPAACSVTNVFHSFLLPHSDGVKIKLLVVLCIFQALPGFELLVFQEAFYDVSHSLGGIFSFLHFSQTSYTSPELQVHLVSPDAWLHKRATLTAVLMGNLFVHCPHLTIMAAATSSLVHLGGMGNGTDLTSSKSALVLLPPQLLE
jgi:hypothetical protein